MYNGDQYRLMLAKSSFGQQLMKWAEQHFTPDQRQNIGAGQEYGCSMMRKCLEQVGEQYTKIKCRPIDKVIYREDTIIFDGIGTYEYHPFAALAFLSLLYGVMLTDDNHKPHHRILDKAYRLMIFLDDKFPVEAKEIRDIVPYNTPTVSVLEMDDDIKQKENSVNVEKTISQPTVNNFYNSHVYVSYPWADTELMDEICDSLHRNKIKYSRDKEDCGFRCNIQNFEEQIADADIVIGIINANSLRSIDCMYELCGLVMNGHPDKRLIPVVDLSGAPREPQTCNQYVVTWKSEMQSLISEMSTVEGDKQNYIDKLAYYNRIVTEFPKLWRYITKHNTSSIPELRKNDWQLLRDEIKSINPKI